MDRGQLKRGAQIALVAVAVLAAAGAAWRYSASREGDPSFGDPGQRIAVSPAAGPVGMRPFVTVRGFDQGREVVILFCRPGAPEAECARVGAQPSPSEMPIDPVPPTLPSAGGDVPVVPGDYEIRVAGGGAGDAVAFAVVPFELGPRPDPRSYAGAAIESLTLGTARRIARAAPCATHFMPDGRLVIGATVLDPSTGVTVDLRLDAAELAWAPTGERLAMLTRDRKEIRMAAPGGSDATTVVREARGVINSITWAPEGDRLAFVARSEAGVRGGPGPASVWVFDLVTGERSSLGRAESVAWAPDAGRLAVEVAEGRVEIVDMEGNRTPVADGRRPAWSPDGTLVTFLRSTDAPTTEVWVVRPSDGAQARLSEGTACAVGFSADGTHVALVEGPEDERVLNLYPVPLRSPGAATPAPGGRR